MTRVAVEWSVMMPALVDAIPEAARSAVEAVDSGILPTTAAERARRTMQATWTVLLEAAAPLPLEAELEEELHPQGVRARRQALDALFLGRQIDGAVLLPLAAGYVDEARLQLAKLVEAVP